MEPAPPGRPHPRIRTVWFLRGVGLGAVLLPFLGWPIVLPVGLLLGDLGLDRSAAWGLPWIGLTAGVLVGVFVWSRLAYRRHRFELGDEAVRIHKGVLLRSTTVVPYARIQDVVVRSGPLLRRYRLATIRLQTAAPGPNAALGDAQLAGVADAEAVVARILERVRRPGLRPGGPAPTAALPSRAAR